MKLLNNMGLFIIKFSHPQNVGGLSHFAWPTAFALHLIKIPRRKLSSRPLFVYRIAFLIILFFTLIRNPNVSLLSLVFFWIWVNGPATVLLMAFMRKNVRAVGPMVFAFILLAVTGSFLAVEVVAGSNAFLHMLSNCGNALGMEAVVVFLFILIVGFLIMGVAGWIVLKIIGARYQAKKFSDQSLVIDSQWLVLGIAQTITLALEGIYWIFTGVVAFGIYKLISYTLMKRIRLDTSSVVPLLLYLRVFALGSRSEKLFDIISRSWRYQGSISLISGPDLVHSSAEPHEFLDFLAGRFSRQFISNENDLNNRIRAMDTTPDPDGRYRINSFYCRADNWKMTMQLLSRKSSVILMDLRSFSSRNMGCLFEIRQLFNLISLEKIIFLADATTNLEFLTQKMESLWSQVIFDSPNLKAEIPRVHIYDIGDIKNPSVLYQELSNRI